MTQKQRPAFRVVDVDTYAVISPNEPLKTVFDAFARGDRYTNRNPNSDYRVLDANNTPIPRPTYLELVRQKVRKPA